MSGSHKKFLSALTALAAVFSLSACAKQENASKVNPEALMENRCSTCHFSTKIYSKIKTAEQWEALVERMRQINPEIISEKDSEVITKYLQKEMSPPIAVKN